MGDAPIDLARARALIEQDGRLVTSAGNAWEFSAYSTAPGPCHRLRVTTSRVECGEHATHEDRAIAHRIERECRAWDPERLRRIGLAVHAWGAAAMAANDRKWAKKAIQRLGTIQLLRAKILSLETNVEVAEACLEMAQGERDEARTELRKWRARLRVRAQLREVEGFEFPDACPEDALLLRARWPGEFLPGDADAPIAGPKGVLP